MSVKVKNYQIKDALIDGYEVAFINHASDPTPQDNKGFIYSKEVDGYTELFYLDNYGSIIKMTSAGTVNSESAATLFEKDEFTATSGQTAFPLSFAPESQDVVAFYINGILYDDDANFTLSGSTITWLDVPWTLDTGDKVIIRYLKDTL